MDLSDVHSIQPSSISELCRCFEPSTYTVQQYLSTARSLYPEAGSQSVGGVYMQRLDIQNYLVFSLSRYSSRSLPLYLKKYHLDQ